MEMVAWVNTSDGWKQAFYDESDPQLARVFEPRRWWRWKRRPVSKDIRDEAINGLVSYDPDRS